MWFTSRICTWFNSIHYLHVAFGWHNQDCQWYTTLEAFYINQTALNREILIDDIRCWYSDEFRLSVHLDHIKMGESIISPSKTVRILGVVMDPNYTMVSHINHEVKDSFLNIKELPTTVKIWQLNHPKLHSMLMLHQDFIIAIICSMVCLKNCLKSVMNTAARLVTRTRKFDRITHNVLIQNFTFGI